MKHWTKCINLVWYPELANCAEGRVATISLKGKKEVEMHYHGGFAIISERREPSFILRRRGDSEVNLIAHALIRRRPDRVTSEVSIEMYLVVENLQHFF